MKKNNIDKLYSLPNIFVTPKVISGFSFSHKENIGEDLIIYPSTKKIEKFAFFNIVNYYKDDEGIIRRNGDVRRIFIPYNAEIDSGATYNMVSDDNYALTGNETCLSSYDTVEFIVYVPVKNNDNYVVFNGSFLAKPLFSITYSTLEASRFSEDVISIRNGHYDWSTPGKLTVYEGFEVPNNYARKLKRD